MYKPVAAYSRTRRRGRSLKISIRDFHCNERRSRRTAKRLSISCKSTTGIAARDRRQTHPEAGARLLVIKMLTPAVSLPEIHRILRIFRAPQQQTRKFSVSEYLFSSFSFYTISLMKTVLYLPSLSIEERRTSSSSNVSSLPPLNFQDENSSRCRSNYEVVRFTTVGGTFAMLLLSAA